MEQFAEFALEGRDIDQRGSRGKGAHEIAVAVLAIRAACYRASQGYGGRVVPTRCCDYRDLVPLENLDASGYGTSVAVVR